MRFKTIYICIRYSLVSKYFTNIIPFYRSSRHENVHKMVEDIDPETITKGNNFYLCM